MIEHVYRNNKRFSVNIIPFEKKNFYKEILSNICLSDHEFGIVLRENLAEWSLNLKFKILDGMQNER